MENYILLAFLVALVISTLAINSLRKNNIENKLEDKKFVFNIFLQAVGQSSLGIKFINTGMDKSAPSLVSTLLGFIVVLFSCLSIALEYSDITISKSQKIFRGVTLVFIIATTLAVYIYNYYF